MSNGSAFNAGIGILVNHWTLERLIRGNEKRSFAIFSLSASGRLRPAIDVLSRAFQAELRGCDFSPLVGRCIQATGGRETKRVPIEIFEPAFWITGITLERAKALAATYREDFVFEGSEIEGLCGEFSPRGTPHQAPAAFDPKRIADFFAWLRGGMFHLEPGIGNWMGAMAVQSAFKEFVIQLLDHRIISQR